MRKFRLVWTLKQAKSQKVAIESKEIKGYFIWICSCGVVMRIVGYHFRRGFIADICYGTKRSWFIEFLKSIFSKKGSIHVTRFI